MYRVGGPCHRHEKIQGGEMRKSSVTLAAVFLAFFLAGTIAEAAEPPPQWAYPVNPPGSKPAPDDGTQRRLPGSSVSFTMTQLRDLFNVPDWRPSEHPPMPDIVA